jgi:23S rRNA (cytidine1920-2'-O)/16S rRNA (cytidine1409-2'-O)-methyltransferase
MANKKEEKLRLDLLLAKRGLVESRSKAQAMIIAGKVLIDEVPVTKVGTKIGLDAIIRIKQKDHPYVSRGGLKLEKGLDYFKIDVTGLVVLDVGASTGGFTDLLLMRGAKAVHALDVGYGQLAWKLRTDSRVIVWEKKNIRHAKKEEFTPSPVMAVMDVSFISILKVIPVLKEILEPGSILLSLVKPQFEVGKGGVGKGGVVRDESLREKTLNNVISVITEMGCLVDGPAVSPITGPKGNVEYLIKVTL